MRKRVWLSIAYCICLLCIAILFIEAFYVLRANEMILDDYLHNMLYAYYAKSLIVINLELTIFLVYFLRKEIVVEFKKPLLQFLIILNGILTLSCILTDMSHAGMLQVYVGRALLGYSLFHVICIVLIAWRMQVSTPNVPNNV